MTVTLTGYLTVPLDQLEEVRAALPEHIALTRAEPGCLSFDVMESVSDPGRFAVSERFLGRPALEAHRLRTEDSDWGRLTQGMTRAYQIAEDDDGDADGDDVGAQDAD